jgi:hypothetical protein
VEIESAPINRLPVELASVCTYHLTPPDVLPTAAVTGRRSGIPLSFGVLFELLELCCPVRHCCTTPLPARDEGSVV